MAIDAFLQFTKPGIAEPIEGESQDSVFGKPTKTPPPAFEIKSWGFGAQNTSTIGSATMGAGGGKANFDPFKVQKNIDTATPYLLKTCCAGGHYPELTLWVRKAGAEREMAGTWYMEWKFAMAFVSKISWANNDPQPTEDVEFVYGAIQFKYKTQESSGALGTEVPAQWSQVHNSDEYRVEGT